MKWLKNKLNSTIRSVEDLLQSHDRRWAIAVFTCFGLIGIGVFLLVIAGIRFITVERGIGLLAPGATLIVAGLTAITAQFGITSWYEQRREERAVTEYAQRKGIYTRVANLLVSHFNGSFDPAQDAELRALVSIWGSKSVLTAFSNWQGFISTLNVAPGISTKLDLEQQQESKQHVAHIMTAIRQDLLAMGSETVEPNLIIRSIFNE